MEENNDLTTLYLRKVPARLVREAKARAARQGSTLTALVTDALASSLAVRGHDAEPADDELRESMAWYEANRERLLQRYRDEYLAIVDREVADHDRDFEALAMRVFDRLGVRPIFMPRVTEGPERARVRSPRRHSS
ncbi:MAG: hypothetical protein ACRD2Z_18570 [Thermoanaerobaculia bacterium]